MITIVAVGTDRTNSTNGFKLGHPYDAKRSGFGYTVSIPGVGERFVCADGHGGAHLQFRKPNASRYDFNTAQTEGHFEIFDDENPQVTATTVR